MGMCNVEICREEGTRRESSPRGVLLEHLKSLEGEEWCGHARDLLARIQFPRADRDMYYRPPLHSSQQEGEELLEYNRFKSMIPEERGTELSQMLTKAYMIIDEEDMPYNSSKMLLPDLASRNLFASSLSVSMVGNMEDPEAIRKRHEKLMSYDPEILQSLERFVGFCEDMAEQAKTTGTILYQMILCFKGSLLQVFKPQLSMKANESNPELRRRYVETVTKFVYFLVEMVSSVYGLDRINQTQKEKSFFTEINLYTLGVSILFTGNDVSDLTKKLYLVSMKKQLHTFAQSNFLTKERYPLPAEFSLDSNTLSRVNSNREVPARDKHLPTLFKASCISDQPYFKCVKMLTKIKQFQQPIAKLKILSEVSLQIIKEIERFYDLHYLPRPTLDGQKLLKICQNILNRCEDQKVACDILITSDFIHNYYIISRKGSSLTPFLASMDQSPTP